MEDQFEKVLGRVKAFDYSSIILGGILGAVIADSYPMVTTYWLSLIGLVLAIFVAIRIKDIKLEGEVDYKFTLKDWVEISKFIFKRKPIRYVAIVGMVSGAAIGYFDEFWQIYLKAVDLPILFFGGVFQVIGFGAVALGSLLAYKVKARLGFKNAMFLMIGLASLSFITLGLTKSWYGLLVVTILYFAMAVIEPLIYGYLHDNAIQKYRATIESAYSFLGMLAVMVLGLPFGFLSTNYNIFMGMIYLGSILALLFLLMIIVRKTIGNEGE